MTADFDKTNGKDIHDWLNAELEETLDEYARRRALGAHAEHRVTPHLSRGASGFARPAGLFQEPAAASGRTHQAANLGRTYRGEDPDRDLRGAATRPAKAA